VPWYASRGRNQTGGKVSWKPEIDELDRRRKLAQEMGGPEKVARLARLASPFRSAESFIIEEIIDPRETRSLLCEFAALAAPLRETGRSAHGYRP
jgi:acetyl-CoA carboxylase carboxyltransferase component